MPESTTDWSCKYAAWSQRGPADALSALHRLLKADGLVSISDVNTKIATSNAFWNTPPVYLVEVRALKLRIPNPFPLLRLWRTPRQRRTSYE